MLLLTRGQVSNHYIMEIPDGIRCDWWVLVSILFQSRTGLTARGHTADTQFFVCLHCGRDTSFMSSGLADVLAQLRLESKELQDQLSLANSKRTTTSAHNLEQLERQLLRARSSYDAALQKRQQQVAELEQLTVHCESFLQASGETRCRCSKRTLQQQLVWEVLE